MVFLRVLFGGDVKINEFRRNLFAATLLFCGLSWAHRPHMRRMAHLTAAGAICYVATLAFAKKPDAPPAIFVSAIIEKPPTPGGRLSKEARGKVAAINAIIRSIKIDKW